MEEHIQIIGTQIRAARATLNFSVRDLASKTGVSVSSIKRYEAAVGIPAATKGHLALLKSYFEARGIEFIGTPEDGPGIRLHRAGRPNP